MGHVKDCLEQAEKANVDYRYDMTYNDARRLSEAYGAYPEEMAYHAFQFGYRQGQKALQVEEKRRREDDR